jgi:hypothetical protein
MLVITTEKNETHGKETSAARTSPKTLRNNRPGVEFASSGRLQHRRSFRSSAPLGGQFQSKRGAFALPIAVNKKRPAQLLGDERAVVKAEPVPLFFGRKAV